MKTLGKIFGLIAMVIGVIAFCAADSDVSAGGTFLIALTGIAGVFGGGWLIHKVDPKFMVTEEDE